MITKYYLQNVSYYGNTANAAKAKGLVRKIQTQKYVVYLHFLMDVLPTLRKVSSVFQTGNWCICSVPCYIEESELQVMPGESFHKLCNQVITDEAMVW